MEATSESESEAAGESVSEDEPQGDSEDESGKEAAPEGAEESAAEDGAEDVVEEGTEEAAAEAGPAKRWYVVHTYSGHENKVKTNLERAINSADMSDKFGQILVATEDYAEMKNGKRTITKRKTFPSYVLVEMDMCNEARHLVTNIPGVTGFVGTGREPVPLRDEEIRRVLGLDAEGKAAKVVPSVPFKVGEHVRVIDGPFSDFTGVVDEINPERGKVKVMVSIFGRATPVELDFLQVQTV
ncbi:MAG: transcription termination/antitermination factor NusG [Candidatus Eiseniibacteriota bacterium]|nr:MAG: transcription termination/antitermination factor NusG [Candidatus Eisenbacteria bacterium]